MPSLYSLVSDWQANGNSRPLGDPTADVWQKCARQLLDRIGVESASARVAEFSAACPDCGDVIPIAVRVTMEIAGGEVRAAADPDTDALWAHYGARHSGLANA